MLRRSLLVAVCAATISLTGCPNPAAPTGDYGSIAGVVSSSAGPIVGAKVCIAVVECSPPTAADGTYKISTVPADPTGVNETVTATATGYQDFSGQVHITAGQQTPFNITIVHV
jgi:hypothetical protein